MVHVQNSTLAGGVAVGTVCNLLLGAHGAVLIGIIAGTVSVLGYRYLTVSSTTAQKNRKKKIGKQRESCTLMGRRRRAASVLANYLDYLCM